MTGSLESKKAAGGVAEATARDMFRQMDLKGRNVKDDTQLSTTHQNTIATIKVFEGGVGGVRKFSTSGVDGRVVVWNV